MGEDKLLMYDLVIILFLWFKILFERQLLKSIPICFGGKIPRVGKAENWKPQEAIPPFSLIEDSIQGRRAETLVKTA